MMIHWHSVLDSFSIAVHTKLNTVRLPHMAYILNQNRHNTPNSYIFLLNGTNLYACWPKQVPGRRQRCLALCSLQSFCSHLGHRFYFSILPSFDQYHSYKNLVNTTFYWLKLLIYFDSHAVSRIVLRPRYWINLLLCHSYSKIDSEFQNLLLMYHHLKLVW